MVLVSCANIGIIEKNRFSEYKIIVYVTTYLFWISGLFYFGVRKEIL